MVVVKLSRGLCRAMEHGLPVARIQMVWHEVDKHLEGPWWEPLGIQIPKRLQTSASLSKRFSLSQVGERRCLDAAAAR
jgi:hypothetical protein